MEALATAKMLWYLASGLVLVFWWERQHRRNVEQMLLGLERMLAER